MRNFSFKNWIMPLYLALAMLLDGTISLNFERVLHSTHVHSATQLLLIGFVLLALYDDQNKKIIYLSLGFGLVSDWFYLGFWGYSLFLLPLTVIFVQSISKAVPMTFTARAVVVLLVTLVWQIYQFIIFTFFGLGQIGIKAFLTSSLPMTLVFTFALLVLTYTLWNYLIEKYPFFQVKVN